MRVAAAPEIEQWLASESRELDWDKGNRSKSERKHGISDGTIETFFSNIYVFLGEVVERRTSEPRYVVLGLVGGAGRGFALIFTIRGDKVRPISCRPMRDSERRLYEEAVSEA